MTKLQRAKQCFNVNLKNKKILKSKFTLFCAKAPFTLSKTINIAKFNELDSRNKTRHKMILSRKVYL